MCHYCQYSLVDGRALTSKTIQTWVPLTPVILKSSKSMTVLWRKGSASSLSRTYRCEGIGARDGPKKGVEQKLIIFVMTFRRVGVYKRIRKKANKVKPKTQDRYA